MEGTRAPRRFYVSNSEQLQGRRAQRRRSAHHKRPGSQTADLLRYIADQIVSETMTVNQQNRRVRRSPNSYVVFFHNPTVYEADPVVFEDQRAKRRVRTALAQIFLYLHFIAHLPQLLKVAKPQSPRRVNLPGAPHLCTSKSSGRELSCQR